jgi:hypothetical protein
MIHKKVKFRNEVYWLHRDWDYLPFMNLSPLEHYDEKGELQREFWNSISYAVVNRSGQIMRHNEVIGTIEEITKVDES